MENTEQLQQEIAKLNGRLSKAVQVFNDQKAEIAALRDENASLKAQLGNLAEAKKSYDDVNTKFFEQINEIERLNNTIIDLTEQVKSLDGECTEMKEAIETDQKTIATYEETISSLHGILDKIGEALKERD